MNWNSCRHQNLLFLLTGRSKELNYACNWGSKQWRERREKGVLTARHTRTIFQGECPPSSQAQGFSSKLFT